MNVAAAGMRSVIMARRATMATIAIAATGVLAAAAFVAWPVPRALTAPIAQPALTVTSRDGVVLRTTRAADGVARALDADRRHRWKAHRGVRRGGGSPLLRARRHRLARRRARGVARCARAARRVRRLDDRDADRAAAASHAAHDRRQDGADALGPSARRASLAAGDARAVPQSHSARPGRSRRASPAPRSTSAPRRER